MVNWSQNKLPLVLWRHKSCQFGIFNKNKGNSAGTLIESDLRGSAQFADYQYQLLSGRQGVWSCWILGQFEFLKRELRQWKFKKMVTRLQSNEINIILYSCYKFRYKKGKKLLIFSLIWRFFNIQTFLPVCIFNFVSTYTWKIEPLKALEDLFII